MAYTPHLHLYQPIDGEEGYGANLNANLDTLDTKIYELQQAVNPNAYVPTGGVVMAASFTPPEGWLVCDGREVSRSTYASLFAIVGTTFGTPSSSAVFKLPNLGGRVVVGAEQGGVVYALGATGGEETHTLTAGEMPEHTHTLGDADPHTHSYTAPSSGSMNWVMGSTPGPTREGVDVTTGSAGGHTHSIGATGGDQSHNNMQPYVALPYWIKT